ncbi:MAG: endolytic transglycosylase MltG, partial [Nannocystaceae bacterium]
TAGKHALSTAMTPTELLEELVRAPTAPEVRVTIPEGWNMLQVASALSEAGFGTKRSVVAKMRDADFLASIDVRGPSLEGYLFPDTYRFDLRAGLETALRRMVARHRDVFDDLYRRYRASAISNQKSLGWERADLVTLASIVEKETGAARERPRIAGVFYNRLRFRSFKPKLLQTDPTIIYGCTVPVVRSQACGSFEGRIRRIHLRDRENVYNTYTHEGLPPGPIANPGKAALEAVMSPERHGYLYFVSRNDGTHAFSKTRAEHEAYVDKYQRGG